jgi:protein transport protein SEC61 subunit gamma-like protein
VSAYEELISLLRDCKRVLRAARKPTWDEYIESAKIAGLGILIVGGVGFLIRVIVQLIELYT